MKRADAWRRRCALALVALWALVAAAVASAGVMTRASMIARFPSPFIVGERDAQLPVWPIFKQDASATPLVGYVFESIDFAPIPGFSGTPVNLLVALDAKGVFIDVRVLSQHEPVFLDGLGEAPLFRFVEQYRGLSLQQNIKLGSNGNRAEQRASANVYIDGVAKATASVRIVNQSLVAAALHVARAKLHYAAQRDPALIARVRRDTWKPMDWQALSRAGLVKHARFTRREVERAFAGTGVEQPRGASGDEPFMDLYVAWLDSPAVGRNLLGESGWQHLLGRIDDGDHALLAIATGSYTFVGDSFVRGAVPDRLALRQGDLPIEMRDLDLDDPLRLPAALSRADAKVFRVIGPAGLDPSRPLDFSLRVTREKGLVYPERIGRDFTMRYQLPRDQLSLPEGDEKSWPGTWRSRAWELGVLLVALGLLAAVLTPGSRAGAWIAADARRLARFRTGFQLFTLLFIGWYAQGQLSIVNVTALIQALAAHRDLGFFMHDPMTVVLWAFVAVSLFVWGRGTFCGWLCPFGALQDLAAQLSRRLGIRRRRLRREADARLKRVKYAALAAIVVLAAASATWSDRAVEIEPFKTAITLVFVRSWPHVLWAGGLVAASAFIYKGFCRYLCPLGAGLALVGHVRLFGWIARRGECGTPCQTCRHRCEYQAIRDDGSVRYDECFQCLECVAIHRSDTLCAPLIARRRGRVIAIRPLPALAAGPRSAS